MISERAVIRMKVPYPSISGALAVQSHMYICETAEHPRYHFVKCQTLKPFMLNCNVIKHYCDEVPDMSRNPFKAPTRIDCDKLFITKTVNYDDALKTFPRQNVCVDLFYDLRLKLAEGGYLTIPIPENELLKINPLITRAEQL